MKKRNAILIIFTTTLLLFLLIIDIDVDASNVNIPYSTYTEDSNGNLIPTVDAYNPGKQINVINNEKLEQPEHIFVDELDYIYISDFRTRKVYILDQDFNYITSLEHKKIKYPKSTYVTEDTIYVVEFRDSIIFAFDKKELIENGNLVLVKQIDPPKSAIFEEGYTYKPQHIVVDPRGNIYVQGAGSTNGLMMLDENGEFLTFFAGNPARIPFVDQIRRMLLTEAQKDKMEKIFVDIPTNLARDKKGYIYTVTSSLPSNPIKKFNVAGTNYLKQEMIGKKSMNSIWIGQYNNIITVDNRGNIYEYDQNGNLLFLFGGSDLTSNRIGLLKRPVAVASNSRDEILVLDQGGNYLQVYEPTIFANSVHTAISQYQAGDYEASEDSWKFILQYNSMFDYAHKGLGDSYMLNSRYEAAYKEYNYANDYEGLSNAFWGIRQIWLKDNLGMIFLSLVILVVLRIIYYFLNKHYHYSNTIKKGINTLRKKSKVLDELLYIFTFLRHPFEGFYEIKRLKRVSVMTSAIIYLLLGIIFICHYQFTNQIFVPKTNLNILYELSIVVSGLILWVVCNYLICSINDGEGSIKNVYNATAYSLSPLLVIMPFVILISNALTYQESIFYDLGFTVMILWTIFLFFFMIKDIHNYEVKETIMVIIKTIFTIILVALFLFTVNALFNQLMAVFKEIITEVLNR